MPHPTLPGAGHAGQHAVPRQVDPAAHIVPVVHVRQSVPSAACTSGMCVPHATLLALAQLPQQSRSVGSVLPGGHGGYDVMFVPFSGNRAGTPVVFGRAVGRVDERVRVTTLAEACGSDADMATCIIVGSSETRLVERPDRTALVYTPRSAGVFST